MSQTFGNLSHPDSVVRVVESNGNGKKRDGKSPQAKWKKVYGGNQIKEASFMHQVDDWQETSTFIAALEKIESWIFSRTVESVWWQVKYCISC